MLYGMEWSYNQFVAIHVANTLVALSIGLLCWHRRNLPTAYRIMGLMGAIAVWVGSAAVEAAAPDQATKLLWASIEFFGIMATPLAYLLLAMEFNGGSFALSRRALRLLLVFPVVVCLLVFSNDSHHLIWSGFRVVEQGQIQYLRGPVYPLVLAYNYGIFLLASVRMLHAIFNFPRHYWHLGVILVLVLAVPFVGSLPYSLNLTPAGIDPTPLSLSFTGGCLAAALLYTRLLDIAPVAREILVDKMREGILVFDSMQRLVDFNHSAGEIMEQDLCIGDKPSCWIGPWYQLGGHLQPGKGQTIEFGPLPKAGGWVEVRISALAGLASPFQGHLAMIYDIALRKQMEFRLVEMASRDALTGLYNRHYFSDMLTRELSRCRRDGQQLAVILMDLDHFKLVNDTYGHAGGDVVLQAVADLIRRSIRTEDCACRWGGEEFVVALPGCSLESAQEKAEEWRTALAQTPVDWHEAPIRCTLSLGIAVYPEHGSDEESLLKASDAALYQSKSEGRNRSTTAKTDAPVERGESVNPAQS